MNPWEQMKFESLATRPGQLSRIQQFEQLIGIRLPADHHQFLLDVNGGRPVHPQAPHPDEYPVVTVEWQGRPPKGVLDEVIVDYLFNAEDWAGIYEDQRSESLTLSGAYREFVQEEPRIAPGFIPMGSDPGGHLFLLDVSGKRPGSVWFWAHDWFDAGKLGEEFFHNLGFIALTFSEFISKIRFKTLD
ncbi:MAG TPA: SMI1/KNR4 family protein [Archangium sp.]|uniref:SMI1/KNR4 family protein n=1 Tax=Archangium sp. TaxID=1872627 RepID=UPI002E31AF08|nr:SMI1/KNR4 family protein [Archangium sp.]HEX5748682.1 SMI1/KNR4 family protein [Archangium sp.]